MTPALKHLFTDKQGFGWLSEDDFVNHFAADVDPVKANVMYAVQQALAGSAFTDVMGTPAWKSVPSWYLVAKDDQAIPPEAEMQFAKRMGATTVEVAASHVAMVSHPDAVVELIEQAAEACRPSTERVRKAIMVRNARPMTAYSEAANRFVSSPSGIDYAYRDVGDGAVPVVLLQHFRGNLDNWDPALIDALASSRRVVAFDNVGVGMTTGTTPSSVVQMAHDALAFLGAMRFDQVDLLGFSIGSFVAQEIALLRPDILRRLILAS